MKPGDREALEALMPRRTGENCYAHALRAEAAGLLNMAEVEEIRRTTAPIAHGRGLRVAALFAALGLADADVGEWKP